MPTFFNNIFDPIFYTYVYLTSMIFEQIILIAIKYIDFFRIGLKVKTDGDRIQVVFNSTYNLNTMQIFNCYLT